MWCVCTHVHMHTDEIWYKCYYWVVMWKSLLILFCSPKANNNVLSLLWITYKPHKPMRRQDPEEDIWQSNTHRCYFYNRRTLQTIMEKLIRMAKNNTYNKKYYTTSKKCNSNSIKWKRETFQFPGGAFQGKINNEKWPWQLGRKQGPR